MFTVQMPLRVEVTAQGSATLVLYAAEPFDMDFSFRRFLDTLNEGNQAGEMLTYTLPPESPPEEFVEGMARWRGAEMSLYFERSLGYVQFSSANEALILALSRHLGHACRVA